MGYVIILLLVEVWEYLDGCDVFVWSMVFVEGGCVFDDEKDGVVYSYLFF